MYEIDLIPCSYCVNRSFPKTTFDLLSEFQALPALLRRRLAKPTFMPAVPLSDIDREPTPASITGPEMAGLPADIAPKHTLGKCL